MSDAVQNVLNFGAVRVMCQFVLKFRQLKRGNTVNGRQWYNVEAIERAYKRDEQEKQNNKQKTRRNASKDTLEKKKNIYNCTNRDAQWYEPRCPTQVQD